MKRTVSERVEEFKKTKPKNAKLALEEWEQIREIGSIFDIINTAFYFGYMRGMKTKKGGTK